MAYHGATFLFCFCFCMVIGPDVYMLMWTAFFVVDFMNGLLCFAPGSRINRSKLHYSSCGVDLQNYDIRMGGVRVGDM